MASTPSERSVRALTVPDLDSRLDLQAGFFNKQAHYAYPRAISGTDLALCGLKEELSHVLDPIYHRCDRRHHRRAQGSGALLGGSMDLNPGGLIAWLIVGLVAGWLAGQFM